MGVSLVSQHAPGLQNLLIESQALAERGMPTDAAVRFRHHLADTGLFSDFSLANLIDSQPRERLDVLTMRRNPPGGERWIAGEAKGLSGAELLQAVKTGPLWVSCRRAMDSHPNYKLVFERAMAEYGAAVGERILSANASILISGPQMGIFFHVDAADTMLWHVRGTKTMWIYPATDGYIGGEHMERILLKENLSEAPYDGSMDADAERVVFHPGDAAAWPLHAPHRVVNGDDLNVSISVEYTTPATARTNGVFYTKGWLRRRMGIDLGPSRGTPEGMKPFYWAASRPLRLLDRFRKTVESSNPRRFDVDLSYPDNIRWRDGRAPTYLRLAAE